jgi:hypothetical protein
VPYESLYNLGIIREGPLSRGQVKNSSKGVLKLATFVSSGNSDVLTSKKQTSLLAFFWLDYISL